MEKRMEHEMEAVLSYMFLPARNECGSRGHFVRVDSRIDGGTWQHPCSVVQVEILGVQMQHVHHAEQPRPFEVISE